MNILDCTVNTNKSKHLDKNKNKFMLQAKSVSIPLEMVHAMCDL